MDQFKDYVGKKIGVKEEEREFTSKHSGTIKFTECHLEDNELTIAAIKAEWNGKFRVWLPGHMGTMDYWADRLNVYVEKMMTEITSSKDLLQVKQIYQY